MGYTSRQYVLEKKRGQKVLPILGLADGEFPVNQSAVAMNCRIASSAHKREFEFIWT
jgi:hypothetical protein